MAGLTLAHELALLAHDDRGAKRMGHPAYDYGLGGALLVELALAGRVVVDDKRVVVPDPSPLGAPLLDEALARIGGERRRRPKDWVRRLAKRLPGRVMDELVGAGIRTREAGTVLLVFNRTRYPVPGGIPAPAETRLRSKIDTAIRSYAPLEPRTAALLALIRATKFERKAFPDVPREQVKARLDEVDKADWAAEAVKKAIQETQAAIMAAVIASSTSSGGS